MTHGMVYGTAHSAVLRGHQPDWGRLAAESFGASLGHAAASQLQQQDALRGASLRGGMVNAQGYGQSTVTAPMTRPMNVLPERERQLPDVEAKLDLRSVNQEDYTVEIIGGRTPGTLPEVIVTAKREEPSAWDRFSGAMAYGLSNAAQSGAALLNDQVYLAGNVITGGLIDDRGAGTRNEERVRNFPDAVSNMANGLSQLPGQLTYYAAHPDELTAEQLGRATSEAILTFGPGALLKGSRAFGATGITSQAMRESFGPQLDRMVDRAVPGMRAYAVEPGGLRVAEGSSGLQVGGANSISETVAAARVRQSAMLQDNVGFNISPTAWDAYPTIGRHGTFVSDQQGVMNYFGNTAGRSEIGISSSLAAQIEQDMGLVPGTLQDGFKVRQITGVRDMLPTSPLEGNQYFLGAGNHLPGGAPEMVINSIPTVDNSVVKTILKVKVGPQ